MSSPLLPIVGNSSSQSESEPLKSGSFVGNVALVSLGCAKNTVDSEVMLGSLVQKGFKPVSEPENAEVVVVNTCAFLESAVQEGIDTILGLAELKKTARLRSLIVAGCMVERYGAELQKSLPEVDRFISTDELRKISELSPTTEESLDKARRPYFLYDESMPRVISGSPHSAYLKISEGCDRPCSFCIIPKIRGSFRSRQVSSVVSEAKELLASGTKELNLIAQDLTAFGSDYNKGKPLLKDLLRGLGELSDSSSFWTRLFYAYPIGVDEELMQLIQDSPVVCNYLDMPIQHASNNVIKAMRRPLGGKKTQELIRNMRSWAPKVSLRTTLIVGFPGETDDDIKELEGFIAEGHFDHLGVFSYSQESEADSFHLPNQVSEEEKEERKLRVLEAQKVVAEKRLDSFVGQSLKVLIDGTHEDTDLLMTSRAEFQGPEVDGTVILNSFSEDLLNEEGYLDHSELRGKFAEVSIESTSGFDLVGRLERLV